MALGSRFSRLAQRHDKGGNYGAVEPAGAPLGAMGLEDDGDVELLLLDESLGLMLELELVLESDLR